MNAGELALLALIIPAVGAGLVGLLRAQPNLREAASLVTGGVLLGVVMRIHRAVAAGEIPRLVLAEPLPGIPLELEVEPLGMIFALVAGSLWIVTTLYAIGYMRGHHEKNQTRFYIFFALAISCTMGVAFAGNLFTLFVFYEALTLSTFPLVTHAGTDAAKRAGRVYLGILLSTSIAFQLFAIIWTYLLTGTIDFEMGGILEGRAGEGVVAVLLALYVFGIGKAAVMPFHRWLPAAMVAPTPVSALLHAVAVVKAGVFSILKITIYVFGIDFLTQLGASVWLMWVAAATIILASLVAFRKDNLKARLAYSTISQLSYVVLGAMLANTMGIIGGGMHIVMHAFGKITLFFCAGAIMVAAHKTEISDMRGLGRTMPVTCAAFFVGTLSIIGLPPAGGTWSKWFLGLGALDAGQVGLVAVLMVSSLLSIGYLMIVPVRAFFSPASNPHGHGHANGGIHEAPLPSLIAIVITSLCCLALFVYPDPFFQLISMVAGP
ncbi:MAG: proton-conducting transporter membrane subunit [Gammaproteobacteria bacterium]|nr:proton-conducting transporter membrane subunit [Gammaproteobacteria bacterium]